MKIIHWTLVTFPDNRVTVDMNRVFVGTDIAEWDIMLATRRLILPAAGICLLSVGCPAVFAWSVARALGLEGVARLRFFRLSYPVGFLVGLVIVGFMESVPVLKGWSDYVRDQEYLVGRRLHTLAEENEGAAANQPPVDNGDDEADVLVERTTGPAQPQERAAGMRHGRPIGVSRDGEDDGIPDLEPLFDYRDEYRGGEGSSSGGSGNLHGFGRRFAAPIQTAEEDEDRFQSYLKGIGSSSSSSSSLRTRAVAVDESDREGASSGTRLRRSQRVQSDRAEDES